MARSNLTGLPDVEVSYPTLVKRVQSTFVDSIIMFVLVGLLITLANQVDEESTPLKIAAIILGLSYEPILMAFAQTLGQKIIGIKVITESRGRKVNLLYSYIRFITKSMLGWLSFVVMHSNEKRRAIHDFAAGTVVVRT